MIKTNDGTILLYEILKRSKTHEELITVDDLKNVEDRPCCMDIHAKDVLGMFI